MTRVGIRSMVMALVAVGAVLALPAAASAASNLTIDLTDNPDPVSAGSQLTYNIAVANTGDAPASAVVVSDDLPNQFDFVSFFTTQGACDRQGKKISCSLGTLAAGATAGV